MDPLVSQVERVLDGTFVTCFMITLTILALWGDDVKIAYLPKWADMGIDVRRRVSSVCERQPFADWSRGFAPAFFLAALSVFVLSASQRYGGEGTKNRGYRNRIHCIAYGNLVFHTEYTQ